MISGAGYKEFAAAFGRRDAEPGNIICVGKNPKRPEVKRQEKYEIVDADTLKECISGYPHAGGTWKSRKILQGMPWYVTEVPEQKR